MHIYFDIVIFRYENVERYCCGSRTILVRVVVIFDGMSPKQCKLKIHTAGTLAGATS